MGALRSGSLKQVERSIVHTGNSVVTAPAGRDCNAADTVQYWARRSHGGYGVANAHPDATRESAPLKHLLTLAACAVALTACSPGKPGAPAGPKVSAAAKFNTDLSMAEFMGHFVDPAAFMYWKASGTEITEAGEKDLSPTTDEGWDVPVTGATMLMEAGNALQLPGRVRAPEADWIRYSQLLTERAAAARAAAEKHDKKGVFDEGGKVYEVCVASHEQFIIQPELKANGPAKGDPLPSVPGAKN